MIEVLGSQTRMEILRLLSISPRSALELTEEIGVNRASVHRHLRLLEQLGLAVATGQRGPQPDVWTAVPEKIREAAQTLANYATGTQHAE